MNDERRRYPYPRPIVVDLFAGAGGMSLGFEQAGFDIRFSVDRDPYHVAVHRRNFPYGTAICMDIRQLGGEAIRSLGKIEGDIDVLIGGPPCQGFSHMGFRDVRDPRNHLIYEYARLVGELRPKSFVMENVPGLQSGETKVAFEKLVGVLEGFGYRITQPVQALNAKDFGVPQNRPRLFVLGIRTDLNMTILYPVGPCHGQPPRPTVEQAIEGLPRVEGQDYLFRYDTAPYCSEPEPDNLYARVARGLFTDVSDVSRTRLWNTSRVSGCLRVRHTNETISLYGTTPPGKMVPGHKLPRLDPAGIAPTLRAGSESERGSHTAPRPLHPFLPRVITVREAARLHGFPDWFGFYPGKWHAYRQIGNAVCPPVARAVGWEIARALGCVLSNAPTDPVAVEDHFSLPEDRPKQDRRITQLDEFPKVVNYLFSWSNGGRGFTFNDIAKAILATRAKMPRTKPERFLEDVSRSRNVAKILELPLQSGFSIIPTSTGGRFVPAGTPGTLEDKDALRVRSEELSLASELKMRRTAKHDLSLESFLSILRRRKVNRDLWGHDRVRLKIEIDRKQENGLEPVPFALTNGRSSLRGCAIPFEGRSLPTKSRIARLLRQRQTRVAVLVAKLTLEHVLVAVFRVRGETIREIVRKTYRLVQTDR